MPLGGIDTGCIDLETSGLLGFCTIFNTHVPRRGPINLPILGLSAGGKTWVLCDKQPKRPGGREGCPRKARSSPCPVRIEARRRADRQGNPLLGPLPGGRPGSRNRRPGASGASTWSPFLPGDLKASMMPAIVFEVHWQPGRRTANRHDRFFLSRSRSEGGRHESVFAGWRSAQDARRILVSDRSRRPTGLLRDRGQRKERAIRRRTGRRTDGRGRTLPRCCLNERNDQPGHVGGRRFLAAGGRPEDGAVRFDVVHPTWNGVGYNWAAEVPKHYKGSPRTFTHMYAKDYPERLRHGLVGHGAPCLVAAAGPGLAASGLHRFLAARLAPRVVGQYPAPDYGRRPLGPSAAADSRLGERRQRAVLVDRVPQGMPERREHSLFLLRQHARWSISSPESALSTLRGYKGYQDADGAVPFMFGGCCVSRPTAIRRWPAGAIRSR